MGEGLGQSSLPAKARSRSGDVKKVVDTAGQDGLLNVYPTMKARLQRENHSGSNPGGRYPLDALYAAQAIGALCWARRSSSSEGVILARVVEWPLRYMVYTDGGVAYQGHSVCTGWRQFPRWSLAPVCPTLAGLAAGDAS